MKFLSFICGPCKDRNHSDCPGGTHCDCQHKPREEKVVAK